MPQRLILVAKVKSPHLGATLREVIPAFLERGWTITGEPGLVEAWSQAGLDPARLDIDLNALVSVSRDVAVHFGRDLPGCVYKTGPIVTKVQA